MNYTPENTTPMKPIWHIYYATRGTAGSYIDSLVKASVEAELDVKAFVSSKYGYRSERCVKCFFPITDSSEKRNRLIILLRALELIGAYLYIALYATIKRPAVNIHLIDDLKITYYLIKYFSIIKLPVYVTCHDVRSHFLGATTLRTKIMSLADKLVVHNNNARTILRNTIGEIAESKTNVYPFPFSSYDEILDREKRKSSKLKLQSIIPKDKPFFLFLGVVKMQKGLEVLLDAWDKSNASQHSNLVIAGKWTDPPQSLRQQADQDPSCIVIDRYISDEEFVALIEESHFIVLPYLNYTHSAILVACGNHNGAVILSDIELFKETMPDYPLYVATDTPDDLIAILEETAKLNATAANKYRDLTKRYIQQENEELVTRLRATYAK